MRVWCRLLSAEGVTYAYDHNGNVITRTGATGATIYTYDFENQLTAIAFADGSTATYQYDALGRRIQKTARGATTNYLYDGVHILEELDAAGAMQARYTNGPGIDEPLMLERGGQTYYYHSDRMASITTLTDASGASVCNYTYDSFGRTQPCQAVPTPYGFAGREYDAESGLYYMRARYYDPATGRFLTSDPLDTAGALVASQSRGNQRAVSPLAATAVLQAGGGASGLWGGRRRRPQRLNAYSYALNNPLAGRDPSGLESCVVPRPLDPQQGDLAATGIQKGGLDAQGGDLLAAITSNKGGLDAQGGDLLALVSGTKGGLDAQGGDLLAVITTNKGGLDAQGVDLLAVISTNKGGVDAQGVDLLAVISTTKGGLNVQVGRDLLGLAGTVAMTSLTGKGGID